MHSWNASNDDLEVKAVLEAVLRPSYLKIVPRIVVECASDKRRREEVKWLGRLVGLVSKGSCISENMNRGISGLDFRDTSPAQVNKNGATTRGNVVGKSLDRAVSEPHLPQNASRVRHRSEASGQRVTVFHSSTDVHDRFTMDTRALRSEPSAKLLTPDAHGCLEKWRVQTNSSGEKGRLVSLLKYLHSAAESLPSYEKIRAGVRPSTSPAGSLRAPPPDTLALGPKQTVVQTLNEHVRQLQDGPGDPGHPAYSAQWGSGIQPGQGQFEFHTTFGSPATMHRQEYGFSPAPPPPRDTGEVDLYTMGIERGRRSQITFAGAGSGGAMSSNKRDYRDWGAESSAAGSRALFWRKNTGSRPPSRSGMRRSASTGALVRTTLSPRSFETLRGTNSSGMFATRPVSRG